MRPAAAFLPVRSPKEQAACVWGMVFRICRQPHKKGPGVWAALIKQHKHVSGKRHGFFASLFCAGKERTCPLQVDKME